MEPSPQSTLTTLVDELRTVGVGVSVGEHLDAARALANIPLTDRAVVRATLQCALVKRTEHLDAFNLLFDLLFSGTNQPDSRPLAALADSELEPALRAAMRSGDTEMLRMLAEEYVRRFSRLEPGSPVAGVFALIAASEAANLDALRDELIAAAGGAGNGEGEGAGDGAGVGEGNGSGGGGGSGGGWRSQSPAIQARLDQAEADRRGRRLPVGAPGRDQADARRRPGGARGHQDHAHPARRGCQHQQRVGGRAEGDAGLDRPARPPALEDPGAADVPQAAPVSVRRTLHLAMGTGGVPFRVGTEPAPPPRPEFVVLADVSGSVAAFSRFTLNLLIALDSRLSRLRAFSFVDGLAEITELVSEARAAGRQLGPAEAAADAIRLNGSSDYGYVMREFAGQYARQMSRRTVVLIVGDARTNYADPAVASLAEVSERVGKLYWLNPEPRRYWDQGDSVMSKYAPYCAQVRECSTLRQIADFVQSLAS